MTNVTLSHLPTNEMPPLNDAMCNHRIKLVTNKGSHLGPAMRNHRIKLPAFKKPHLNHAMRNHRIKLVMNKRPHLSDATHDPRIKLPAFKKPHLDHAIHNHLIKRVMNKKPHLNHAMSGPRIPKVKSYHCPVISHEDPLYKKLHTVPKTHLDKLHPQTTDPSPFAEYVDQGLWKNRIEFVKDGSPSVLDSESQALKQDLIGKVHPNLDALCEMELERRYPHYTRIKGLKAILKNTFPNLVRWLIGEKQFYQHLTAKEINKYKKQIAYSSINRDDLSCHPEIEDPRLRAELGLKKNSVLKTKHHFAKNSPLNGQCFLQNGQKVYLKQAIACSSDRKVENTGNLRVIETENKTSICYAGRADSEHKALELASFIFFQELHSKCKGLTESLDKNGETVYQLDYVVNSLLSTPAAWGKESPIAPFPEREYLENELKSFAKLKNAGILTLEDPHFPGRTYRVKFNPITFSRPLSFFSRLENWLPPFFTGQSHAEEISKEGLKELEPLVKQKLNTLQQALNSSISGKGKEQLEEKIQQIENCWKSLENHSRKNFLLPEEELLYRDLLCKLLDLPAVYHCKSSTDRTSIAIALSSALKQWMDLNLPLPKELHTLLDDWRFKELFALNWMAGHQVTRYARGAEGTVCGQTLDKNNLGLALSRGIFQMPAVTHLVPKRYLKDFPLKEKLKLTTIYALLALPLFILFYIPLCAVTAARHFAWLATLGTHPDWLGPRAFTLPILPWTLVSRFFHIIPNQVLNEDSPQVGERRLIAGGKKGGKEDN